MFLKCNHCDPTITRKEREEGIKPVKTIDTETDNVIRYKKKYYHHDCFVEHMSQKEKSEEEIYEIIAECQREQEDIIKENAEKDSFFTWIMDFYDSNVIPEYFMMKIHHVRIGKYKGLREPIDYVTLLDIYQHMERYLRKLSMKKEFAGIGQHMTYDLAVVVGNYEDYKRYKQKQELNKGNEGGVDRQINVDEKVKKAQQKESKSDEFDITEVIDDLLL